MRFLTTALTAAVCALTIAAPAGAVVIPPGGPSFNENVKLQGYNDSGVMRHYQPVGP